MKKISISILRLCLLFILMAGLVFQPQGSVHAAANLTITPITWNVIGLDSNNINVGPNNFPVGARVCNTGDETANNVSSTFNWEAVDPTPAKDFINLRPGSNSSYSGYTLAPSACVDFYYEVQVTRNASAYNDTRRYYITATADTLGTVSTPRPRELLVEYLISQNRNAVTDIRLDGTSTPAGGTMNLLVGNTYNIQLVGKTATQGYEQLESFINFPNTIFQVNSVTSTYSANAGTDASATSKLYADGCGWVNDPGSPNYRSCTGTGKYGGNVTITYNVTIIGGAGTTQSLNTLIYDFSGSSYHYNADFSSGARFASILGPSSVEIAKTFTPKAISPGGTSVLSFKLTNPTTDTISGVNFTDSLLGGLKVAATPNVSYSGCGAGAFSPAPVADATSLSFSNGTIAPNSTCTINVSVTADTAADYPNTTGNLFINTSVNTGNTGSDTLKVSSASACLPGQVLATWTFPTGSSATTPAFTTRAGNVTTALASTTASSPAIETNASYGNPAPSWGGQGFTGGAYFQFQVDTSKYTNVTISFNHIQTTASWNVSTVTLSSSPDGTTFTSNGSAALTAAMGSSTFNTTAGSTYFRISATGAQNTNSRFAIDNVTFTGCLVPAPAPTLTKSFSPDPIVKGAATTLTFTIANTAVGNVAQTGISFTDILPDGLSVANGTASACNGTNNLVTTAATRTIALTGSSLAAGSSCTINVTVMGVEEGAYENITGFLSSNESGTSTSYATDTLTVIAPPEFEKSFSPTSILTGETSALQFTINNPNPATVLTGIDFTDTLPAGVTAVDGNFNHCNGTLAITGGNLLTFSGGSVNANSACTFSVTVTGATTGTKNNTTSNITSAQAGNGNTASATLVVSDPQPLIGLLKQISTDNASWVKYVGVIPTGDIYYRFTITNDGETTLNNINVTDPNVSMGACTPALPASLAVGESASCVVGPISISSVPSPNPFVNTATVATSTYSPGDEGTSSAQYGTISLTLDKTADKTVFFTVGETITYSYLVTNNGGFPLLGPVTVTDDKATVTCPDVNTVGDLDNYLDPGESITCSATYTTLAADITAGRVTNTASASVEGVTSNTDSVTVTLPPDLTVTKTNNVSGSMALGNSFNWTITVTNSGVATASFANGEVIMSDTLPGAPAYYPQGDLFVTVGATPPVGSVYCFIAGTAVNCSASGAVTLPEGASFSVTFAVTPTAAGSLANTATVDPNSLITELNKANNTGSDTVTVIASPVIAKSFAPNPIVVGGTSTLTVTITNSNAATVLTGVGFTDALPAGLQVAATPNATVSAGCGSPTFTPSAGNTTLTFTSGTIPALGTCTVTVNVTATTAGTKNNTTGDVTSTNGGTGNTASSSLNVFDAQPSKSLVTTSESFTGIVAATERVAIGEMVRYRLAALIPEGSFTNVQLLDGIPTGMQFLNDNTATVAFVCNGGASCMTSSTLNGAGLVVNGSSTAVSPTFVLPGAAISGDPFGSGTDVTFSLGNLTNSDSDADSEYVVVEFNALVLNVNATATINQGVDNLTGASNANNRQNDVTLRINGANVGSASPNVTVSIAEPAITSVTKSVAPATGPYLPGDSLIYTLSFSNNATGTNAATAFDIVLTDTFNANLTPGTVNISSTQGATCAGGNAFTTGSTTVGQDLTVNISCLDPGQTVTVTVAATISAGTGSGTTIPNSASLTYTSLPGAQGNCASAPFTCSGVGASGSGTGERNGSGGTGADSTILNNYAVTSNMVNILLEYGSITITKDAVPDNAQDFTFTGSGPGGFTFGGGFSLDDDSDGALPNTLTFTNLIPGSYSMEEGSVTGWLLTGLACIDPDNGSTTDLGTATASIDLDAGENVVCTFTNTLIAPPSISKNFAPDPIFVNGTSTLTFTITNPNAGTALTGVGFIDPLPAGLQVASTPNAFTSVGCGSPTFAPTASDTTLTFSDGTIPVAATCTVSVDVTATSEGAKNNSTGNITSTNGGSGNIASDTLTVNPLIDVSLDKQVSNATPAVGSTVTFTLVIANAGPSTATNIVVTDVVPSGYTYVAASITGGTTNNDANPAATGLTWSINSLAAGASTNLTYQATVLPTGTYDNYAEITSHTETDVDSTPGNNSTTEDDDDTQIVTPIAVIDVSLDKQVSNATPTVGSIVTFTLVIANAGPSAATNIVVTDVLPSGYTYVGASITGGDARDDANPTTAGLTWSINSLAAGASTNLTYQATVLPTGTYDNYAEITSHTETDVDSTPGNNSTTEDDDDTQTVTPLSAIDVSLDKQVSNVSPNVGSTVTFTLVIANAGPSAATNIVVTDVVPSGYIYVGASITGGDARDDANPTTTGLTWTINSLAAGASTNLTYQATILPGGAYDNYAEITSHTETDVDSTPGNGSTTEDDDDTETVTPVAVIDVSLDKQVNDATPDVGDTVTFTLVIANAGPSAATNIVVTDLLPSGYTYVSASITGGDARDDANPAATGLTWTINSLAAGVSTNLTYQATVLPGGAYDNYAEITSHAETDGDSTPGNNSTTEDDDDTVIVTVVIVVDPAIAKVGNPTQASVGETVTFTLTVFNQGNAPAPDVIITDTLLPMFDVTAVNVSGAPFGTSVNVTPAIGTGPAPYTVVVTLGGDLGVTDVVTIDIVTTVNSLGNPPVNNTASLTTSATSDVTANNSATVTIGIRPGTSATNLPARLPATGFAPNRETLTQPQPRDLAYAVTDIVLEVPSLGVKIPIVGIPKKNGTWDVSWLGNQAGWLEGTAFPSWKGNSVLTSHVYNSNGLPGPFVNLNKLKYGDKLIIRAYGQKYVFEVRTNQIVEPNDTSTLKHEERAWLTLVTCKEYDAKTNTYKKRVVVRAVMMSVEWDR